MNATHTPLVSNELDVLAAMLPLQRLAQHKTAVNVIELGCGSARLSRELMELGLARSVTALEVDARQHAQNVANPHTNLTFLLAGAAAVPCGDASFDLAMMLKSLHHVPLHEMGRALNEVARVLKPGGWFYVSEPVYEGPLNDIVKLFNEEREVREAAQAAVDAALQGPHWTPVADIRFMTPVHFPDFETFERKMMRPTFADHRIDETKLQQVRAAFMPHVGPDGARFVRPMHVRLLRRA